MKSAKITGLAFSIVAVAALYSYAADKVPLDAPNQVAPSTQPTVASPNLAEALKGLPDGVLRVRKNPDGTFKSLVVKATVDIDDVLGGEKGKRMAHLDAQIQCKRELSQWISDYCAFTEGANNTTIMVTKGNSSRDAAGNTVNLRTQKGQEIKTSSQAYIEGSKACLRGLIVLQSEVTADKSPEYVLVMGLSDKSLAQSASVKAALSGQPNAGQSSDNGSNGQNSAANGSDEPAPQVKTNPDASGF